MSTLPHTIFPPISVIVCTRDRPAALRGCLTSLALLDYPTFEIVVVDNCSRDGTMVRRLVEEIGGRYVREERRGLNWARNRGACSAHFGLIAYTDDDARVDPGWLRGLACAFADPRVACVTGLVLPAELETRAQRLFEQYSGMGKGQQPRRFTAASLTARQLIAAHELGVGANMAFRRSTLGMLGGFDTALDVGTPAAGGGDLDMFHRVLAAGLSVQYEPAARVWHIHRRDMAGLRRQIYCNGRAFGVYLLQCWKRRSVPRRDVGEYALRWVGGWLLARLLGSATGKLDFPVSLSCAEVWGALHAPWAYLATYRADRRAREAATARSARRA
jgi:glycosyltransferase involved in cell wall biosynthesis